MNKYFIIKDGLQIGPLTKEQLIEQKISKDTLVWYDGIETWIKAELVEELSSLFVPTPPPPPVIKVVQVAENQREEKSIEKTKKKLSNSNKIIIYVCSIIILISISYIAYAIIKSKYYQGKHEGQQEVIQQVNEKVEVINKEIEDKENGMKQDVSLNFEKYFVLKLKYNADQLFGGLSNITLTLNNNSNYKIESLESTVIIYKSNGDIYDFKNIHFYEIGANESQTMTLDNTTRGTKAEASISSVTCKAISLEFENPNRLYNFE